MDGLWGDRLVNEWVDGKMNGWIVYVKIDWWTTDAWISLWIDGSQLTSHHTMQTMPRLKKPCLSFMAGILRPSLAIRAENGHSFIHWTIQCVDN
jgi:hypothetical protein